MYKYRKPQDSNDLIRLLRLSNTVVKWSILDQKFFDKYYPILLIYDNGKIIGRAYKDVSYYGKIFVYSPCDKDITDSFSKAIIKEIDCNLRQLELKF